MDCFRKNAIGLGPVIDLWVFYELRLILQLALCFTQMWVFITCLFISLGRLNGYSRFVLLLASLNCCFIYYANNLYMAFLFLL